MTVFFFLVLCDIQPNIFDFKTIGCKRAAVVTETQDKIGAQQTAAWLKRLSKECTISFTSRSPEIEQNRIHLLSLSKGEFITVLVLHMKTSLNIKETFDWTCQCCRPVACCPERLCGHPSCINTSSLKHR